jgi:hypothetical protein
MEGWTEVLDDGQWQQTYIVVNPQRIIGYKDYRVSFCFLFTITILVRGNINYLNYKIINFTF